MFCPLPLHCFIFFKTFLHSDVLNHALLWSKVFTLFLQSKVCFGLTSIIISKTTRCATETTTTLLIGYAPIQNKSSKFQRQAENGKTMWYIHGTGYYLAIKRNVVLILHRWTLKCYAISKKPDMKATYGMTLCT